jgi:helix-turn-helix protein
MKESAKREEVYGVKLFWDDLDVTTIRPDWSRAPIISNEDFILLLGISKRTAVRWRMGGKIRYVQFGQKVYYTVKEIERFLKRNEKYRKHYVRGDFEGDT